MVSIRLRRIGSRHRPAYRVVVADKRAARDGAFIETIGHYNPLTNPTTFDIDEGKALAWLNQGAQPSDTVRSLLRKTGIWDKFKSQPASSEPASEPE
ncbi:MAG: 30S ribosomal protein S16 [Chloroflexota bacterium]|nr:30S ribosomal protein S16 [Chloroflexota bacterium]